MALARVSLGPQGSHCVRLPHTMAEWPRSPGSQPCRPGPLGCHLQHRAGEVRCAGATRFSLEFSGTEPPAPAPCLVPGTAPGCPCHRLASCHPSPLCLGLVPDREPWHEPSCVPPCPVRWGLGGGSPGVRPVLPAPVSPLSLASLPCLSHHMGPGERLMSPCDWGPVFCFFGTGPGRCLCC